ncbi:MAG: LytTR family transcriptional regulator [Clostridium sp.]|nr:LytTR family transcriptional regulator [Clostridium sp.]
MEFTIFTTDEIIRQQIKNTLSYSIRSLETKSLKISRINPKNILELEKLCEDGTERVIIADISNKEIYNGDWVQTIKYLSTTYSHTIFVLISNGDEKATTIFRNNMRVLYFINRFEDDLEHELRSFVDLYYNYLDKVKKYIYVSSESGNYDKILFEDILFIETIKGTHKCLITHKNGVHTLRIGINTFLKKLDSRFVLCRPSTIANIENISNVDFQSNILYFNKGVSCTFSRSNKKKIKGILKMNLEDIKSV